MITQLNKFVAQKKQRGDELHAKQDLQLARGGPKPKPKPGGPTRGVELTAEAATAAPVSADGVQTSTAQLIRAGRREMSETEKSVLRSARLVEDTASVGQQTAVMLTEQGAQIERTIQDLDEIGFSLLKAKKLIGDISKSMATDRCIQLLLVLVVGGIIVIVVLKAAGISLAPSPPPVASVFAPPPPPVVGRRMLRLRQWPQRRADGRLR
jgi:SNARE protein